MTAVTVWLIGLAGAGKTTIGREVAQGLREAGRPVVLLDGDDFRRAMGDDLGHTLADRERNGWRMARLCAFLNSQGIDVVCCILSLFREQREWNRANIDGYFEVFIDVPMAELERRDQKGLYSRARAGLLRDVAGVDILFVPPERPHLVVNNSGPDVSCHALAARILTALATRPGR